jgi:hypothetical protein
MNNYLQSQPPVYNRFINNQVLTESQLNSVLNHLNYQDKSTRVQLTGVGIVCGLEISHSGNNISLTKGVGITTDGDLIQLDGADYKNFRRFDDSNVRYERFIRNEKTIPLWELTEDPDASDAKPLSDFEDAAEFELNSAVALVYLEYYHREPEDCSPVDCNSQGKEVVNRLRVLLISADDAEHLIEKDTLHTQLLDKKLEPVNEKLKPVRVRRVVHSGKQENLDEFTAAYRNVADFKNIAKQIELLGNLSLFKDEMPDVNVSDKLNNLGADTYRSQYFYNFYRDIAAQLNEITDFLRQNISLCCPDSKAFPKHLLLGSLRTTKRSFRHGFFPSPALNHPVDLDRLRNAYKRLLLMIRDYKPDLQYEVRVTPSLSDDFPLSERAIPAYYNLESSENSKEFVAGWRQNGIRPVPNYFEFGYEDSENPIDIHLKDHNFFRVEGHNGQSVTSVLDQIKKIKTEKDLAFKVLPVSVGNSVIKETIDTEEYRTYFEDLQSILDAWNRELECLIKKTTEFMLGFDWEEPGKHIDDIPQKSKTEDPFSRARGSGISVSKDLPGYDSALNYSSIPIFESRRNVVIEQFVNNPGYLGNIFYKTIQPEDSLNDIRVRMMDVISERSKDVDEDLAWTAYQFPVEIIGTLKEFEDRKITDTREISEENIVNLERMIWEFCSRLKEGQLRYRKILRRDEKFSSYTWTDKYSHILQSLTTLCCFPEKIEGMQKKIERRKTELFRRFRLAEFVRENPGAEHLAGVPKGGTFIVLYTPGSDLFKIARGTVIGDLCLPYICCSGAPPVTFVIPDEEVILRLPTDHICMKPGERAGEIKLDVTPATGEVKALIDGDEQKAAILEKDGEILFDPNEVAETDYGKPIRFSVNETRVDPVLRIYEKPEPEFSMEEEVQFTKENTVAAVTFVNKTKNREQLIFEWDFGDGETESTAEETVTHLFNVEPGSEFSSTVRLIAENGPCSDEKSMDIEFKVPEREIDDPAPEPEPEPEPEPTPEPEPDPEANCKELVVERIERSLQDIRTSLRDGRRELNNFNPFVNETLQEFYKSTLNEIDLAIRGEMDDEINDFIFKYMMQVQMSLQNQSGKEQVFSLLIYYELVLFYIYIRACRNEKIPSFQRPNDAVRGWVDFTNSLQRNLTESFRSFLRESDTIEKFQTAYDRFDGGFSQSIDSEIRQIMEIMQNEIG